MPLKKYSETCSNIETSLRNWKNLSLLLLTTSRNVLKLLRTIKNKPTAMSIIIPIKRVVKIMTVIVATKGTNWPCPFL